MLFCTVYNKWTILKLALLPLTVCFQTPLTRRLVDSALVLFVADFLHPFSGTVSNSQVHKVAAKVGSVPVHDARGGPSRVAVV